MKILTENKISQLKNEAITKMYDAICEYHEMREMHYHPGEETIKSHDHDIVLDLVLKHFYKKPTGEKRYDWSRSGDLSNLLPLN